MAKIHEELIVIKLSKLHKESQSVGTLAGDETVSNLEAVIQQLVNHFDNVLQARVLADIGLHEVRVFQSKIREHYCFNSLDFLRRVMHRFDDREHVLLNII